MQVQHLQKQQSILQLKHQLYKQRILWTKALLRIFLLLLHLDPVGCCQLLLMLYRTQGKVYYLEA